MAVAVVRTFESWKAQINSLIICTEGLAIHEPYKVAARVCAESDINILSGCRITSRRKRKERYGG